MYGSSFIGATVKPRLRRRRPREAVVMPFPIEETTPPVTKMYFVIPTPPETLQRKTVRQAQTHQPKTSCGVFRSIQDRTVSSGEIWRVLVVQWPHCHAVRQGDEQLLRGKRLAKDEALAEFTSELL